MDSAKDAISSHPTGWIYGYVTDDILEQWAKKLTRIFSSPTTYKNVVNTYKLLTIYNKKRRIAI
jgi:hypothetical protein